MIPSTNDILNSDFEIVDSPTIQHKMIISNETIIGRCDNIDALKQTIFKILNTERYAYEIYTWNYGVEFADLIGEPVTYCVPEIERRIVDALMVDDRITDVDSFDFDTSKRGIIAVKFTVHSIYGEIEEERAVNV